jgi:Lipid A core - O-antigen ligase and related enzymes
MRDSLSAIAPRLVRLLGLVAIACLFLLTIVDSGATRAYSAPWSFLLWTLPGAALLAFAVRACHPSPLTLPSRAWSLTAAAFAGVLVLSAVLSLQRGPSLLVAFIPLGAIASFFLLHDYLQTDPDTRAHLLLLRLAQLLAAGVVLSVAQWLLDLLNPSQPAPLLSRLHARNPHPLGHSNYTAGLALLALPLFFGLALSASRRAARLAWSFATLLAFAMLFSSGSRGGFLAFAVLAVLGLFYARLSRQHLALAAAAFAVLLAAFAVIHPRTRAAIFAPSDAPAVLSESDRQRASMSHAALLMGADRPLFGWGPGTTPFAFPRYRAQLDGGVENVLQLHSTPLQLFAETGAFGLLCGLAFTALLLRAFIRARPARGQPPSPRALACLALAGYLAFSVFDFQLDVPVFAFATAALAALAAPSFPRPLRREAQLNLAVLSTLSLALVLCFGSGDPTPIVNAHALTLAADPTREHDARELLEASLVHDPHQEIAHFNLGWLLLVSEPVRAEKHFRAALRLVPDKGGVYFGLALARMNQGRADDPIVPRALALECLNDPLFLTSPWWRQQSFAEQRLATFAQLHALCRRAADALDARHDPRADTARYIVALAAWFDDLGPASAAAAHAATPHRIQFFNSNPNPPDFSASPINAYRRTREGYPVLMRNLDLPPPVDLFDVQENLLAADLLGFLFPPKGWLPSPLLLELLDAPTP